MRPVQLLKLLLFIVPLSLLAQPKPYGCQHWRTLNGSAYPTETSRSVNPSIAWSDTFDILHYDIHLDICDMQGKSIKALTEIRFKPLHSGKTGIAFDFFHQSPNDSLPSLLVDSVGLGTALLQYSLYENRLYIQFPEALPKDTEQVLSVYYHGIPHRDSKWGGFIQEQGYIYTLGIGITSIPPNFGKVWYPCFDSFAERATYTYHVKSAGNYRAHCQGEFLGEQIVSGDTVIRSYSFNQPIPTHISAIAASNYADLNFTHQGVYGPVDVRLTAKPGDTAGMRERFVNIGKAIDACEFWYGPNPYSRVGYVTTTMGALEIPENIAYPTVMLSQPASVNEGLYAHELGHYWWGDWVAPYSHNDMWLKEGPAEYSSHLMTEFLYGRDAFIKEVKENQYYVLTEAHVKDKGFWPLSPIPDSVVYGTHTYNKGAAVMHNLRAYMGDSLFRKSLRGIQQSKALGTLSPEQFRDLLEAESGISLDYFFENQVFSPGFSVFVSDSFQVTPVAGQWEVTLFLRQLLRACDTYYRQVPLEVTFIGTEGQEMTQQISAGMAISIAELTLPFEPARVILNRNNRLNMARMDHELRIYPQQSIPSVVPLVDFRIFKEILTDTAQVRIEHIWAGPDTSLKASGIDQISNSHYWIVSGVWKSEDRLAAQLSYVGVKPSDLDYDLFQKDEKRTILVYRRQASEPWRVYSDFTVTTGSLFNGAGTIRINNLIPGEYAFAKGDKSQSIEYAEPKFCRIFPNPANQGVYIEPEGEQSVSGVLEILGLDGRVCQKLETKAGNTQTFFLSTSDLPDGLYLIRYRNKTFSQNLGRFIVMH